MPDRSIIITGYPQRQGGLVLVLTRKIGERINIGDNIVISVLEINRGSVRIGIDAPRQISILRHEVYEKIRQENLNSSQGISADVEKAACLWRKKVSP